MSSLVQDWKIYRTRFLIKATQLEAPLSFIDPLGREHFGQKGDYLVESTDGLQRIAPRAIFEDIYVPMETSRKRIRSKARDLHSNPHPSRNNALAGSPAHNASLARRWTGKTA
jgi:hypothetical protein